jgi:hypothetical protein
MNLFSVNDLKRGGSGFSVLATDPSYLEHRLLCLLFDYTSDDLHRGDLNLDPLFRAVLESLCAIASLEENSLSFSTLKN